MPPRDWKPQATLFVSKETGIMLSATVTCIIYIAIYIAS